MKLIVILVNLSLILSPLKSEENIPNNLIQAKINNPFKLSKITYRLNNIDHFSRTELTSTQLEADSKLEHFYILDPLFTVIEEDKPYKTIRASIGHFNRTSNLIEFEEIKNINLCCLQRTSPLPVRSRISEVPLRTHTSRPAPQC